MSLAIWNGPFDCLLPDFGIVRVGEQHNVTNEDLRSAHWTPVAAPAPLDAPTPEPAPEPQPVAPAPDPTTPEAGS